MAEDEEEDSHQKGAKGHGDGRGKAEEVEVDNAQDDGDGEKYHDDVSVAERADGAFFLLGIGVLHGRRGDEGGIVGDELRIGRGLGGGRRTQVGDGGGGGEEKDDTRLVVGCHGADGRGCDESGDGCYCAKWAVATGDCQACMDRYL